MYAVPDDWRSDIHKIMDLSRHLCAVRGAMTREGFNLYTREKMKLSGDTTNKVMKLSEHPILSDPKYADKLPVQWAKLYELSFLPDDTLVKIINDGTVHDLTKYQVWSLRGGKPKKKRVSPRMFIPNPRGLELPQGVSLTALVQQGIQAESELGLDLTQAADRIGVGRQSYRMIRQTILLSERSQLLTPKDAKIVSDALESMEKTHLIRSNYAKVVHLVKKVWGGGKPNQKMLGRKEKERRENFIDKIAALSSACERVVEIEIPYLSASDVSEALNNINDGIAALAQLGKRIRGEANE